MKSFLRTSLPHVAVFLILLLTGCGTLTPVTQAYPSGEKPSKEEAMRIVKEALATYPKVTVDDSGIATKEYNPLWFTAGGPVVGSVAAGAMPLKRDVVFSDVASIKFNKNFQGGGFVLYDKNGKKLLPSGVTRQMADPAYMNRVLAALLVLCPNVE